ncbi:MULTISPECIES: UxaA family hydrolase [Oscillospiraceae]|jgi:mannonate dehydratase|uniref:UxaA family hydrolase n=1 Tax=Oscillospiraceae TaxID=216572 RepID=UPI0003ADB08E|nr:MULTISPECIES: UxaA family hydrolase [unclassified Oscillibacter]ERK64604.1 SAF domain protein [Oscillibacter sp. KLE 1728]ERK67147.1 SAF domain protein [Oscillibacter sp. KLE 1745]
MEIFAIVLNEKDNVAVVPRAVAKGSVVTAAGLELEAAEDIPVGHKIAIAAIPSGSMVVKYGTAIGQAECDILPGQWVHTHNVKDITEQLCNEYAAAYRKRAKEMAKDA